MGRPGGVWGDQDNCAKCGHLWSAHKAPVHPFGPMPCEKCDCPDLFDKAAVDQRTQERDAATKRAEAAEAVCEIAREFVQVAGAFPDTALGPKTKMRFYRSFAKALGLSDNPTKPVGGEG